jgi:hypothetical protein
MTRKPNFSERLKPPESNSSTKMAVGLAFDFESRANGDSPFAHSIFSSNSRDCRILGDLSALSSRIPSRTARDQVKDEKAAE